jgi:hypothetical protein
MMNWICIWCIFICWCFLNMGHSWLIVTMMRYVVTEGLLVWILDYIKGVASTSQIGWSNYLAASQVIVWHLLYQIINTYMSRRLSSDWFILPSPERFRLRDPNRAFSTMISDYTRASTTSATPTSSVMNQISITPLSKIMMSICNLIGWLRHYIRLLLFMDDVVTMLLE